MQMLKLQGRTAISWRLCRLSSVVCGKQTPSSSRHHRSTTDRPVVYICY